MSDDEVAKQVYQQFKKSMIVLLDSSETMKEYDLKFREFTRLMVNKVDSIKKQMEDKDE